MELADPIQRAWEDVCVSAFLAKYALHGLYERRAGSLCTGTMDEAAICVSLWPLRYGMSAIETLERA